MGFDFSTIPLWKAVADEFPVNERLCYLNHAAVAPLSKRASAAMRWLAEDNLLYGSLHYDLWLDTYDGIRTAAAALINSTPEEIAIVKNTSEGVATVQMGLDWRAGDKVVAFREEFPANYYPWKLLEGKGVRVEWCSIYDSLQRIDEACAGARLLAVSFVNYLTGYRVDLKGIGEICRRHGTFFFVDAIQGLGAFPLDVRECGIDALSSDGHKWLLGPEGCGLLYVRQERQDEIFPVEFGWTNVAKYADYSSRDMTLRPDAGRYECGTLNTVGCFGLRAALDLVVEVGVDRIAPVVQALGDQIAHGVTRLGCELAAPRTTECGAGIVSFRHPDVDSRLVVSQLKDVGIIAAPRQGWVRTAPHYHVPPEGVDRLLERVRGILP
ncbi:MAG: aminotransferase class V-fold PLP-dependent enzyme [Acidobacteria bacterium]|nr:aminotransferase class V-fold PLP-dependent enzyme [Acidobacteriota bacterium]